ncbi:MAG TPA: hypothetical protein VHL79_23030 [Ramlibacter sp.]|jgi:4-diphosphocytidyl-2C-methyl-D-erythritol kinase|nr:hypothetical protein [Ramlibacter sp.]
MNYQNFVRAAAGVLAGAALASGAAFAQGSQPAPITMTDTAPSPASERNSLGAVIMMDQPVLAQREAMLAAQERTAVDTRALGAGPSRILRNAQTPEAQDIQRAFEEAERRRGSR